MPRKTPEEKLADLEQKERQLKARIQKTKSVVRNKTRKQDTRRKIIAGALALEHMAHDTKFRSIMGKLIEENVTRPNDRELFDL